MKICQNLLSICIFAFAGSALAGSFDPPAPLIPNNDRDAENQEIFKMFHFFMPENGLPPRQETFPRPPQLPGAATFPQEFRTIDGTNNNLINPTLGSANTPFLRTTTNAYADGHGTPACPTCITARAISNAVDAVTGDVLMTLPESAFWWAWGQFIDHDMTLTPIGNPTEEFDITVPTCDPQQGGSNGPFDPNCTGGLVITFQRSAFVVDGNGVRQQLDANTQWLDASMVYGSDDARASELRPNPRDGTGHLKVGINNLLPLNVDGFPNEPSPSSSFFIAGDVRANENSPLAALQTLFMREHNFWADFFHTHDTCTPACLDDDGLYNRARAMVGAEIQKITYQDFLPSLIGKTSLSPYTGYNGNVDPSIANVFSAAAWRFGHSLLNSKLTRLDANLLSIGALALNKDFFQPTQLTSVGVEPYLRGLAHQKADEIDGLIVDPVRNFAPPHGGGFDLAGLNIQRGRDHGLPRFNQVRLDYGLSAYTSFAQLNPDPIVDSQLQSVYSTVDDIDAWVGMLVETHQANALVGPTLIAVLKDQFQRLRDGDRFWYEAYFDPTACGCDELATIQHTKLSDIIIRNTTVTTEIQPNVFAFVAPPQPTPTATPTATPRQRRSPTPTPTP